LYFVFGPLTEILNNYIHKLIYILIKAGNKRNVNENGVEPSSSVGMERNTRREGSEPSSPVGNQRNADKEGVEPSPSLENKNNVEAVATSTRNESTHLDSEVVECSMLASLSHLLAFCCR
jgi:hypothetical protein